MLKSRTCTPSGLETAIGSLGHGPFMRLNKKTLIAVFVSMSLHALVLGLAGIHPFRPTDRLATRTPQAPADLLFMEAVVPPEQRPPPPTPPAPAPKAATVLRPPLQPTAVAAPAPQRPLATAEAPPAPTAEEWAFAAQYTLKNSKGYRHAWGQQVRSLMGTAVEGPDQGVVRFRVEMAPNGTLAKLDTLWTTSPVAERLARQAMAQMPALPPTPNGKPLVFEKTISFSPFLSDSPPVYQDDCLPDPPNFRNRFALGEKARQARADADAEQEAAKPLTPEELVECLKQLPQNSMEAEAAHDQRQLEQWGSSKLGRQPGRGLTPP